MAALTADRKTVTKTGDVSRIPVKASTTIYKGSLVCVDATGYAVPGADTGGLSFMGVAIEGSDNSAGASGDLTVLVQRRGLAVMAASGLAVTDQGDTSLYISDDQTVAKSTTNSILAGKLVRFTTATEAEVELMPASGPVS